LGERQQLVNVALEGGLVVVRENGLIAERKVIVWTLRSGG
jgi:hypothetical protein